jgi:hypothetical protein
LKAIHTISQSIPIPFLTINLPGEISAMEFDKSNAPFFRLPPPHGNIILAIGRDCDGPAVISMLNDPAVYTNLAGSPFPYTQAHFDAQFEKTASKIELALAEFREVKVSRGKPNGRKWVNGAPFTVIREIDPQTGGGHVHWRFLSQEEWICGD